MHLMAIGGYLDSDDFSVSAGKVSLAATPDVTELGYLDGATPGTQKASKCVVADANVNTGISKVTELHIGASGSETQVTATPAELNKLDGTGAVVASGTQASKINDPSGGATVDTEARTAINSIIDVLEAFNISASS